MPTSTKKISEGGLPYSVQRMISKHEPAIRERILAYLTQRAEERGGGVGGLRLEDVGWAISCAMHQDSAQGLPKADPRMVSKSLAAYRAGDYVRAEDFVNERKARIAAKASGKEA